MEETKENTSFVKDVRNILFGTSLNEEQRLKLIRNMTLFILGIELELDEYSNKRKDSIIKEQARFCEIAEKRAIDWIEKASLSRYYLSYLRRGLINFINTGDLNYSASNFRCNLEDLCLCYDVLKEQGNLNIVRLKITDEVKPVFLSETSIKYIMEQIKYAIRNNLDNMRFITDNGVEEKTFIETDLKLWAYRVMYIQDGVVDLVYLVNYLKRALHNHCENIRERYLTQRRNTGLVKVNGENGASAEYSKIVVPLTDELSEFIVSQEKIKKDGVPEFIDKINFGEREKKKLKRFFNIINGTADEEFELWLMNRPEKKSLENLQGNAYIDELSKVAIEFIGMSYLMPRIRDSWEVFYDCENLPPKSYRYMQGLNYVLTTQIPTKVKCMVLVNKLKYYPDDFVYFLKSNGKNIEEIPDETIKEMSEIYYGKLTSKELVLYLATAKKVKV